jgi:uncharacterized membrane protein YphA (DoxX/SURF4 family)
MTMAAMQRSTALMTREPEVRPGPPAPGYPGAALVDRAIETNRRYAPTALRLALAVVFVWFGALKVAGVSPVHDLIASTLPFLDPNVAVPALGGVEVAIGLALALGRLPRLTLLVMIGHLAGTFLTFVTAAHLMWAGPLQLTSDGEFVVKNLVLITAALLLIASYSPRGRRAS